MLIFILYSSLSFALNQRDEAYLWVGTEVFPTLVKSIVSTPNTNQAITVVYLQNRHQAEVVAQQLKKTLSHPIHVRTLEQTFTAHDSQILFISHPDLQTLRLIEFVELNQILSFSPFYQAVSKGADAGIVVKEQVRPQINLNQLQRKNIVLKPFFVRVAESYE
ncbi:YfiR/HmsC family protein [Thiomicrospira sp.]|uniref:YfiR/HmsC family protein n=1 Tax=Thiomicrospira sp. TaxID=935 RepID=UPI0025EFD782|nr:YfiR/HmsC family protein [Thiomicrospira sp.]